MNILLIRDDKPGHYNQTEGLLQALLKLYPDAVTEYCHVEIRSKLSRKILRFLLNRWGALFRRRERLKYVPFFYRVYTLPENAPDIILSTGGNTSNLNAWFAKVYRCKNILNGALRGFDENHFTCVTTLIDLGYGNQVVLEVAPSGITEQALSHAAHSFADATHLDAGERYYALLVGGDGSGYRYDQAFYDELAGFVAGVSKQHGVKWLITTSRRTPVAFEASLKQELAPYSAYFVAYNQQPEKVLLPFLGLAEKIFVTEESSSMISEAVASKKPVWTLRPNQYIIDTNYQTILDKLTASRRIQRIVPDPSRVQEWTEFVPVERFPPDEAAAKLRPFLVGA